jgi:hypothetical protein
MEERLDVTTRFKAAVIVIAVLLAALAFASTWTLTEVGKPYHDPGVLTEMKVDTTRPGSDNTVTYRMVGPLGDDPVLVRNVLVTSRTLNDALDNGVMCFECSGPVGWFGETVMTHDGVDAAQSGPVETGQFSLMESVVQGPGTLSFYWRVSSEAEHDYLRFSIDGRLFDRISGEHGWALRTFIIEPGRHVLRWKFSDDANGIARGLNAGWIDQVRWP